MNTQHILQKEIENLGATVIMTENGVLYHLKQYSVLYGEKKARILKKSSPSLAAVLWNIIST